MGYSKEERDEEIAAERHSDVVHAIDGICAALDGENEDEGTVVGELHRLADAAERGAEALENILQVLLERMPVR